MWELAPTSSVGTAVLAVAESDVLVGGFWVFVGVLDLC
jgi:hypothetical protein